VKFQEDNLFFGSRQIDARQAYPPIKCVLVLTPRHQPGGEEFDSNQASSGSAAVSRCGRV